MFRQEEFQNLLQLIFSQWFCFTVWYYCGAILTTSFKLTTENISWDLLCSIRIILF